MKNTVLLTAWNYNDCNYNHLIEESLYMPNLNAVLAILTIPCDEFDEAFGEGEWFHNHILIQYKW
jgi:hypothetical protein